MRIVAISDTHSKPLPRQLAEEIKKADMVFHVGDFADMEVLTRLKSDAEVRAVYGNMDGIELREALPRHAVVRCEGVKIGLVHGEGGPDKLVDRVRDVFKNEDVEVIVFGHSHVPMNERVDGVLMFNPGSPTDTVRSPYCSYGILEIEGDHVKAQIIKIK